VHRFELIWSNSNAFSIAGRIQKPTDILQESFSLASLLEPEPTPTPEYTAASQPDPEPEPEPEEEGPVQEGKANAAIIMLARNGELEGAMSSMRQLEGRFNHKFQYPWIFLNEEPFTTEFKEQISALTNAPVSFGLIPHDDWFQPDWIDEDRARKGREDLVSQNVIYADSVSYRNMCRFQSQAFYRQELVLPYRWYWRVEPNVDFTCIVDFDPFAYLQNNNKIYGFTIAPYEFASTIPTLWPTVKDFINENPQYLAPDNAMGFLSDNGGKDYNLCHFWSNFEIADMRFWRGEAYSAFTKYLDSTGGFYYERWGDAPVHSIAASLFANKSQIHFFDEIGYRHAPWAHCPRNDLIRNTKCDCSSWDSFDYNGYSCYPRWHIWTRE